MANIQTKNQNSTTKGTMNISMKQCIFVTLPLLLLIWSSFYPGNGSSFFGWPTRPCEMFQSPPPPFSSSLVALLLCHPFPRILGIITHIALSCLLSRCMQLSSSSSYLALLQFVALVCASSLFQQASLGSDKRSCCQRVVFIITIPPHLFWKRYVKSESCRANAFFKKLKLSG